MRYIKATTLNSIWIIEEDGAGIRKVVDIKPREGELRDVHRSILADRPVITFMPTSADISTENAFTRCIWGGPDDDQWHSSRVQSLEDIEWTPTSVDPQSRVVSVQ